MRTSIKYLLLGAGFGAVFPLVSTLVMIGSHGIVMGWGKFWEIQANEPLLWVIDTAPLFLGLFAWMAGVRQEKLEMVNRATTNDLEHLFRISQDILCVCSMDGRVLRSNLAFEKLLGQKSGSVTGKLLYEFVHPEDQNEMQEALAKAGTSTEDTYFENRLLPEGKDLLFVEWSISMPLENKYLAIGRNVSLKRESELKLTSYAESLERSLFELDQFAYVVSHDLKAPLRGIYSLADFIDEDLETGDHKAVESHLNLLRKRVDRMQNLIIGVLEYSRAGKDLNTHATINLADFLADAVENMTLPEGFVVDFPSKMPSIQFNPTKLLQIFQNLLSNAAKHNPNSNGRAEIACRELPDRWELSVTDNGPGIPERFHEQVFTIFRTLKSRDVVESTGIGLPIVKKIVEEAGGVIYIDKNFEEGTRVVFSIVRN